MPTAQTGVHAPNPQRTATVTQKHLHRSALKAFLKTKGKKTHPVKPAHPVITSHPKVAVTGLGQRTHKVLGQPLLPLPRTKRKRHFRVSDARTVGFSGDPFPFTKSSNEVAMAISLNIQPPPPPPWRRWIWSKDALALNCVVRARQLTGFSGARAQVRIQPHRHQGIAACHVLNLENNGAFDARVNQFVGVIGSNAGLIRSG